MNNFRHQTNVTICARITPRTTLLTMQWQLWFQLIYFHINIISYIQSHNYLITFCLNCVAILIQINVRVLAWFPSRPYSWTGTRLAHAQAEFPPSHPVLIASYLCFCEFAWTSGGKHLPSLCCCGCMADQSTPTHVYKRFCPLINEDL